MDDNMANPNPPAGSLEELRERAVAYCRRELGVPPELDPEALEPDGSPLLPLARQLRESAILRVRLLDRAAVGGDHIAADAVRFAAEARAGRVPWRVPVDPLVTVGQLVTRVTQLDDVLVRLAGALRDAGVACGLIEPPPPPRLPQAVTRVDTPRLGDVNT